MVSEEGAFAPRRIRVLSASVDARLNHTRWLLLQYHGFDVTASDTVEHAREQIQTNHFDVLIFGSSLTRDTCWQLAEDFRKRNAIGKIVEILPAPWAPPKNRPDATVVGTEEPTKLVSILRQPLT